MSLQDELDNYVTDMKIIHQFEHWGAFEDCKITACQLAVEIENGVSADRSIAIKKIIEGR
jgi:hypothetical protein